MRTYRPERVAFGIIVVISVCVAYLAFWPVPVEPVAWQAPRAPGYTGVHAPNNGLVGLRQIAIKYGTGPEHVVVGPDRRLYTGLSNGRVIRMNQDGEGQEVFTDTGGRPLGIAFDAAGNMLVTDAIKGLLSVTPEGKRVVLADTVDGTPIRFPDALVVARNGRVYFSDASTRFSPAQWGTTLEAATLDVIEQSSTGRVLEFDPASKTVRVVAHGLSFANGIALSADERHLFVCESGKFRVWKIDVRSSGLDVRKASTSASLFFDNLPGYPDNLMRGADGRIWLGLAGQRNELDALSGLPAIRRVVLRIPRMFWKMPAPYGHVIAFTEDGKVVEDLQDAGGTSPLTTGATETRERLYIHNADKNFLGWRDR